MRYFACFHAFHISDSLYSVLSYQPFSIDVFPEASTRFFAGSGKTFLDDFNNDQFASEQRKNAFYPFASQADWEVASWLYNSRLSLATMDKFFALEMVSST